MHFGQHLRAILKQKSCTQQRAGELLEMSQQAFAYYLTKPKLPRRDMLEFMSVRLGISLAELTGEPVVAGKAAAAQCSRCAVLERENAELRQQLAAIQKVLHPKP